MNLNGGVGGSIGYGLPMLPFPHDLQNSVQQGGTALTNTAMSFPSLLDGSENFGSQKKNFSLIGKAAGMLGSLFNKENSDSDFGAGLSFNFNPKADETKGEERFRIMAGIRKRF